MTLHYRSRTFDAARLLYCPLMPEPRPTEADDLARHTVDVLADRQAEDTVLLDIRRVASFADYFVITTAMNARHMHALVDTLAKDLAADGVKALHREGDEESGWVLLDYGSVIVHLFSPELREFYALEELWQTAKQVVRIQ